MFKKVILIGCDLFIKFIITTSILIAGEYSFAASNIDGIQVYQKNGPLSLEHKQKIADALTRYRNADNLWDILREEFALPHYEENPAVQAKIEWFMNNQDYLLRSASRAGPYLYYILQQIKKRHLPAELVLLPIIESGYNPFSLSSVGAAGIWQLMPGTATGLGIKRDWWYDGRLDVIASTRAALYYLAYLQSFFEGDWLRAIAAYNTGEGNVLAAIKRNIREGKATDFWSLPVAQQTKDYVPSLLALAIIISRPDQYPIYFPPVRNAPYLAQVDVGMQINLKYAAMLAGISHKKIIQLNPGFKGPSTSTKGPYKLVLPIENVEQFTENLARSPLNRPLGWIHYTTKSGDTLASISKKFTTTVSAIRKMNHLAKNNNIRGGTNLLIPNASESKIVPQPQASPSFYATSQSYKKKSNKKLEDIVPIINAKLKNAHYNLRPGDTIYMVRSTDTLQKIAKRFHLSVKVLVDTNQLENRKIKIGKQLIIPTHPTIMSSPTRSATDVKSLQPGDTIYMVRHGDTIAKIARKFHITQAAIRLTNLVDDSSISAGDKLIIPTHLKG